MSHLIAAILLALLFLLTSGLILSGLCQAAKRGDHDLELARPYMVDAAGVATDLDAAPMAGAAYSAEITRTNTAE